MTTDRRTVISGIAASMVAGAVGAQGPASGPLPKLFAATPFADNRVARAFSRVDLALPDVPVLTEHGRQRLTQLAGRARLLTLWAEWCVPCLLEARDLAAQQPRIAGGAFDIVSVLTASSAKLDYAGAIARLNKAEANGLTVLVEPDGGHAIAEALSARPTFVPKPASVPPGTKIASFSLPCTLLVDRHGRARGRATGVAAARIAGTGSGAGPTGAPHRLTEAEKQALLSDGSKTAWSTPDGAAFLKALHDGLLDRI